MSKYHNQPTIINGIKFDSRAEGRRYEELLILERAGKISNLECQPKFHLLDGFKKCPECKQRITKTKRGHAKSCPECGAELLVFQARYYIADFRYQDKDGNVIIEDVKGCNVSAKRSHGTLTPVFMLKRHLFEAIYPELTLRIVAMKPERVKKPKKPALMVEPVIFTGGKKRVYS
jgi:hypothetical protein